MNHHLIQSEFQLSAREHAFERWLGRVEALIEGRIGTTFGTELLMSDAALSAFEDGVTASDYALMIQAAGVA